MKSVIIKKISMLNFKGVREMEISFDPTETSICGRNGSGKTTIFDAFMWVLFGKDSQDRKQFDIKTLDSEGVAIPKLPHEVTVTLMVDGEEVTLTRRYAEKWQKKRGSAVEEFTGHEETRLYNEVPCSVKDWSEKIAAICGEQVFKFITTPGYFCMMKSEVQKEMLIKMAGDVSDEEIAKGNEAFERLLGMLTGKTLDELKREIGAKKKRIKTNLDGIPPRIDELNRYSSGVSRSEVEAEIEELEAKQAEVKAKMADASKVAEAAAAERTALVQAHAEAKQERMALEYDIKAEVEKAYREQLSHKAKMQSEVSSLTSGLVLARHTLEASREELARQQQMREGFIQEWRSIQAESLTFSDTDFVCPTCGRPLEVADVMAKQQEMAERFNADKAQRMAENNAKGKANKAEMEGLQRIIQAKEEEVATMTAALTQKQQSIQAMGDLVQPDATPAIQAHPQWQAAKAKEEELAARLAQPETPSTGNVALNTEDYSLTISLREATRKLVQCDTDKRNAERVKELEAEMRKKSEELAQLEGIEFTMLAFSKARIAAVEQRINSLFKMVRFSMFTQQINGGEVERVEATVDGVPYSGLNHAGQINAGLDIIQAICKHEGITAPVFIDNAEAVNTLMSIPSQMVRLIVSHDPTLKVAYKEQPDRVETIN